MGIETTMDRLHHLKYRGMAEAYEEQLAGGSYDGMSFDERFGLLVEGEYLLKKNKKIGLRHRQAKFAQSSACIENIDYSHDRGLVKDTVLRLASCRYIAKKENIVLMGQSDSGKSYLGCALGNAACRNDIRVRYFRLSDLFAHLGKADVAGTLSKCFREIAGVALLILDDFLLSVPTIGQIQTLVELLEQREYAGSTIICTQLNPRDWQKRIDEVIQANCIYSRIVPAAHLIELKGTPMREKYRFADFEDTDKMQKEDV
jgi:DNA replication protein DnaC